MKNGSGEETRTPNPRITNALLYQLSYSGILDAGERVELSPNPAYGAGV